MFDTTAAEKLFVHSDDHQAAGQAPQEIPDQVFAAEIGALDPGIVGFLAGAEPHGHARSDQEGLSVRTIAVLGQAGRRRSRQAANDEMLQFIVAPPRVAGMPQARAARRRRGNPNDYPQAESQPLVHLRNLRTREPP